MFWKKSEKLTDMEIVSKRLFHLTLSINELDDWYDVRIDSLVEGLNFNDGQLNNVIYTLRELRRQHVIAVIGKGKDYKPSMRQVVNDTNIVLSNDLENEKLAFQKMPITLNVRKDDDRYLVFHIGKILEDSQSINDVLKVNEYIDSISDENAYKYHHSICLLVGLDYRMSQAQGKGFDVKKSINSAKNKIAEGGFVRLIYTPAFNNEREA